MIGGFHDDDLIGEIERTYHRDLVSLCTSSYGSYLHRDEDAIVYASGLPVASLNGVFAYRFSPKTVDSRINEVMSQFKEMALPMSWVFGPSSAPKSLESKVIKKGLAKGEVIPGMAMDINDMKFAPLPSSLIVKEIKDPKLLDVCCNVISDGFQFPKELSSGFKRLLFSYGLNPSRRWFLGLFKGDQWLHRYWPFMKMWQRCIALRPCLSSGEEGLERRLLSNRCDRPKSRDIGSLCWKLVK